MQSGILCVQDGIVVEKIVYGGDTSAQKMAEEKQRLEELYPSWTIEVYESDTDPDFTSAQKGEPR